MIEAILLIAGVPTLGLSIYLGPFMGEYDKAAFFAVIGATNLILAALASYNSGG